METEIVTLARDIPLAAVLLVFIYVINKQYTVAITLLEGHLSELNLILAKCVEAKTDEHQDKALLLQIMELKDDMGKISKNFERSSHIQSLLINKVREMSHESDAI